MRYSKEKTGLESLLIRDGYNEETIEPYIEVIDDGDGINAEVVENLFEPFYTTNRSGTGLGLYIAKELCESNHARLEIDLNSSRGACFRITFSEADDISINNVAC